MSPLELQPSSASARHFCCPSCRGDMSYDDAKSAMVCHHCGHSMDVGTSVGVESIVEYDLESGEARERARGLGIAVRVSECRECGALVNVAHGHTADQCAFCGASELREQRADRQIIRPEGVVPFRIDRAAAHQRLSAWLRDQWLRPADLNRRVDIACLRGMYVPYWTFDAKVDSEWTAEAGYHYWGTETSSRPDDANGGWATETRRVRCTRWEPVWGARSDSYEDVLVCASRGLPFDLVDPLVSATKDTLVPYRPEHLVGWNAEEYAIELNDGWTQCIAKLEATQENRCAGDVPGDTQRFLRIQNRFRDHTFRHVLLPVWIAVYGYHNNVYRFLVSGQTGEIAGQAPYSRGKLALLAVLLVAAALGLAAFAFS